MNRAAVEQSVREAVVKRLRKLEARPKIELENGFSIEFEEDSLEAWLYRENVKIARMISSPDPIYASIDGRSMTRSRMTFADLVEESFTDMTQEL